MGGSPSPEFALVPLRRLEIEEDLPFVPASEDELIEVQHLLAEPQTKKIIDEDVMHLHSEGFETYFTMEDIPCIDDYCYEDTDYGILDRNAAQADEHYSEYDVADSMLQGIHGEVNLRLMYNTSSDCPDYLSDAGYEASSQMDFGSSNCSSIRSFRSERHNQSIERDIHYGELTDATKPLSDSTSDQNPLFVKNMGVNELQDVFRSLFGRDTYVTDKHWLKRRIQFGLQNFSETGNNSGLVENGLSSENEQSLVLISSNDLSEDILDSGLLRIESGVKKDECSAEDPPAATYEDGRVGFGAFNFGEQNCLAHTGKRLRRPTRRYVEETADIESTCCSRRFKTPNISSGNKLFPRTKNQHHFKGSRATSVGSHVQCDGPKGTKEHVLQTIVPQSSYASRLSEPESQDELFVVSSTTHKREKSGTHRNHHRPWTVSEVMKLVEGVSLYGVGRWTEIKRLSFSSRYRTHVDLKDKWRNLLRASGAQMHHPRKVKPQQRMTVPIPQSILQTVRELSVIHPYPRPRERKAKLPSAAATANTSVSHSSARTLHGRSFA